jgi:predicted Zn-dependent protease
MSRKILSRRTKMTEKSYQLDLLINVSVPSPDRNKMTVPRGFIYVVRQELIALAGGL